MSAARGNKMRKIADMMTAWAIRTVLVLLGELCEMGADVPTGLETPVEVG